jgi:hypothetical protein
VVGLNHAAPPNPLQLRPVTHPGFGRRAFVVGSATIFAMATLSLVNSLEVGLNLRLSHRRKTL